MSHTPLFIPSPDSIKRTFLAQFMQKISREENLVFEDYFAFQHWAKEHSACFWQHVWQQCGVIGTPPLFWDIEHEDDMERAAFFPTARLNFAQNLLQRRDDATAIHFFCEDRKEEKLSYSDLYTRTAQLQQCMQNIGITAHDRVGCYLPNIPDAVIGMLATASLGAIWSTCSPDFGIPALVDRFGQIQPRLLFMTDGYFYHGKTFSCIDKLEEICTSLPSLEHIVIIPFVNNSISDIPSSINNVKIHNMDEINSTFAPKNIVFEEFPFNHPLYIAYSSGTTGVPKCIVHRAGGILLQHLKEHQLHCDIQKNDSVFYFTTCSWMMWHWLVSSLGSGAKIVLYEGSPTYPTLEHLFFIAKETNVKIFGTSAKYLDNLSKNNVSINTTYDLPFLTMITSTGSPLLPETSRYVYGHIKERVTLSSISGGTDILSCFVLGSPHLPVYAGEIQTAGLGLSVDVLDEFGNFLGGEEQGELVCTRPFPAQPLGFWNDEDGTRYHNAYFATYPNIWHHGDFIAKTKHGGYVIYGRSDTVLNPGGVRIGTAEIYRQVEALDFVLESLCIGQPFEGDERIILFVKLKEGLILTEKHITLIKEQIRHNTTPRHVPALIIQAPDIPRTKNNKIAERAVKDTVMGKEIKNTSALLNPEVLEFFKECMSS